MEPPEPARPAANRCLCAKTCAARPEGEGTGGHERRTDRRARAHAVAGYEGGGPVRIDRQHSRGKLTARERLDFLLDPGSFVELDAFVTHRATEFGLDRERYLGDGVVTGHGTIDGRLAIVFSQDCTVFGGSLSEAHAEKICKVDSEHLGGASIHTGRSGVAHLAVSDEAAAMAGVRRLLAYLPADNLGDPPRIESSDPTDRHDAALDHLVPDDPAKPYDMRDVLSHIVDDSHFLETQPAWAANILVGFARLGGWSVGIVAQQPFRPRGGPRHRRVGEGGTVRPHLRLLQRPTRYVRRRAGLPARCRAGGRRDHQARCEAPARVL